jgi:N-acetylglucosamine kinase-like BadF-type ATPase
MSDYFLGVDTGATKSHALIADENGRILGFGEAGPGNWESVGWEGARRTLDSITAQATSSAGITRAQISGAGFGLAGYDWPEDRQPHIDIIRNLGVTAPFEIVNDAFIGLLAGASSPWGVAVSAGTSCNCYGRNPQGQIGHVAGSSRFGEYAGAAELVTYALQAVARAWSKRGPETRLTESFIEAAGAQDAEDLLAGIMRRRYKIDSAHASRVFDVAKTGDAVAVEAVKWAGRELGGLANGVIGQLAMEALAFEVVLSGSLYKGSRLLKETMRETICRVAPQARLVRLNAPPVIGGVLLGMEQVGLSSQGVRLALIKAINP